MLKMDIYVNYIISAICHLTFNNFLLGFCHKTEIQNFYKKNIWINAIICAAIFQSLDRGVAKQLVMWWIDLFQC